MKIHIWRWENCHMLREECIMILTSLGLPAQNTHPWCSSLYMQSFSCLQIELSKKPLVTSVKTRQSILSDYYDLTKHVFQDEDLFLFPYPKCTCANSCHNKAFFIWKQLARKIHHVFNLRGYQIINIFMESVFLVLACSLLVQQATQKSTMGQ